MNKICTSIEQSKKLIELGIDVNTADMCWSLFTVITNGNKDIKQVLLPTSYGEVTKQPAPDFIERNPAWSLSALLSVLPIVYINNKKEVCGPLHIDITDSETPFVLWYVNPLHKGCIIELQTKEYDNLVDACVEMILKLKENNKLL